MGKKISSAASGFAPRIVLRRFYLGEIKVVNINQSKETATGKNVLGFYRVFAKTSSKQKKSYTPGDYEF